MCGGAGAAGGAGGARNAGTAGLRLNASAAQPAEEGQGDIDPQLLGFSQFLQSRNVRIQ
jgi:hypothetical protein